MTPPSLKGRLDPPLYRRKFRENHNFLDRDAWEKESVSLVIRPQTERFYLIFFPISFVISVNTRQYKN